MSVLRRPDDHRRNLRRRAPRALAFADPDQDRHLMTVAALPAAQPRFSSPPTARWSRKAMSSQGRRSSSKRRAHIRPSHPRPRKTPSSSLPPRTMRATGPRSPTSAPSATPNPHRLRRAQPNSARGFLLTRLSDADPASSPARLQRAGVRNPSAYPDQDRHLMTVAALPAAQPRFSSPPTARWSRKAMSSQGRRSSSKRRAHTRPSHPRPRKTPSSSLPPRTMRATGPRSPTGAPSATPKSP